MVRYCITLIYGWQAEIADEIPDFKNEAIAKFVFNLKIAAAQDLLIFISRKERKALKEKGVFLDYTPSFSFLTIHPIDEKKKIED